MCVYWKKLHTCDHTSDRPYIEMCRSGCLSNTVCTDIAEDATLRPSHFPCWLCIKAEARADAEAAALAEQRAMAKAQEARDRAYEAHQRALKEKQAAELKVKEEKIRREAKERAAREREHEVKLKREMEEEELRAKREGGLWIETGSGRKSKGRKNGVFSGPTTPVSSLPVTAMTISREWKENEGECGRANTKTEAGIGYLSPKKDKRSSQAGRAGIWGPPKKILARVENGAGSA